jgi:uncharacterized membrane protein
MLLVARGVGNVKDCGMHDLKSDSSRVIRFPVQVFLFASIISAVIAALRIGWTHDRHYLALIWNLFLAWMPLLLALQVHQRHERGERGGWRFWGLGALWLLFFPNAPYIFTDLVHLTDWFQFHFWVDLSLFLLVALTGFLLGYMSLYLMQAIVARRLGSAAGWLFIVLVAGVSGFGIYLGRFKRWNSWDVVMQPLGITRSIGHLAAHPLAEPASVAFSVLFTTFLFVGYLMLYALTHLQPQTPKVAAET